MAGNLTESLISWLSAGTGKSIAYQFASKNGFSIYSAQGEIITKKDILGNYLAEFPFSITYRSKPMKQEERIAACALVDGIGDWLKQQVEYFDPCVLEIKQETTTTLVYRADDGSEDYQANFKMSYKGEE